MLHLYAKKVHNDDGCVCRAPKNNIEARISIRYLLELMIYYYMKKLSDTIVSEIETRPLVLKTEPLFCCRLTKVNVVSFSNRVGKVSLYDHQQLDFQEVFEAGIGDLKEKFDLAIYVANIETGSNQTTTRLNWIRLMAANAPWFEKEIPTVFVSTANPYHLFDVPYVSTFINGYTGNAATVKAIVRKITGQESFQGTSPIDPFCGEPFVKY